ncbi:hypothetical protein [Alteromonas ponticola]|uniref:DUF2306 domain-containing protein n=1 Tax=Alteromonas ponticola TaxID=2720613 RepID=A0ABX1R4H3_9ALTE|nr:hypothetical protein [Alteromonas ponticola]NMH60396.1 hypothetical protein [Alteromonas ponticola]
MGNYVTKFTLMMLVAILAVISSEVHAAKLTVEPESHWWLSFGAAVILYAHIGAGVIGVVTGFVTSFTFKGGRTHRMTGRLFVVAMLVCYLLAAIVSPFLETQQSTNFVAAILALYLLISGTRAAQCRTFVAGLGEKIGLVCALFITMLGATFMYLSYQSPDGSFDGSPAQAYVLFIVVGSLAFAGDLTALVKKSLSHKMRISRHLWRMCMSFFIASGSLFFGQAQVFPDWFNASLLPLALGFFPIAILIVYFVKRFLTGRIVKAQVKAA